MSGFELNKIAGAVLLAGLIAMVGGKVAEILYHPEEPEKRGFEVAVEEAPATSAGGQAEAEAPVDIAALIAAADASAGEKISAKCTSCHNFDKGGPNNVGPNLWGVAGRPKGSHEGFAYSDAMKAKGGNWDDESLYHFLKKPKDFVPGTKMAFAGFKKPEEVANLIAFLHTKK